MKVKKSGKADSRLIDELLELSNGEVRKEDATFYEIIGRSRDEDLISRMLAYVLNKDKNLVNKLLKERFGEQCEAEIVSIVCEKAVIGGRIDIFIEAKDDRQRYTVSIENKIRSHEHDEQTNTYCSGIERQYRAEKYRNGFFYLKPVYNTSEPCCVKFKTITYKDLYDMMEDGGDEKIKDFKRHIKKYFCGEIKMNEVQIKVLENYKTIKDLINGVDDLYNTEKENLFEDIKGKLSLPKDSWDYEVTSLGDSYRIYNKEWYEGDKAAENKFYFYAELLYKDADPNLIYVQGTVKRYGKNAKNSIVTKFLSEAGTEPFPPRDGTFSVFYQKQFHSDKRIFTPEWKGELLEFAVTSLQEAIQKTNELFEAFSQFKSK